MNNQEQLEPIDFLSEDGHSYSIFTLENHLNEAKTQNNEIIYTCEATSKKIKSALKFISLTVFYAFSIAVIFSKPFIW